jgi:AraC-like DNA-binding protein
MTPETVAKFRAARDRVASKLGRKPKLHEVAEYLSCSRDRVWQVLASVGDEASVCRERSYGGYPSPLSDIQNLARAKTLLREGVAVDDVARNCGYKSRSAFVRAFAGIVGKTPSEGRARRTKSKPKG